MINLPLILFGKLIYFISRLLNIGSGGTWPGEIALNVKPDILKEFSAKLSQGSILVAGTNGKTTTSLMIKKILQGKGFKVIHNASGANLLNGIVSTFLISSSINGRLYADWGVFEIDENSLPIVLNYLTPKVIVILNLFRDQLDRYGEVDVIAEKWGKALLKLPTETKLVLNADDPLIAHLAKAVNARVGLEKRVHFFGLDEPKLFRQEMEHATDSIFCLNCGSRLSYEGIYYSHIGIWRCGKCGEKRPEADISKWNSPLPGLYNRYNTLAAVQVVQLLGVNNSFIKKSLAKFMPAFGRQEEFIVNGKKVLIFLSKNPAGFNESLRTVISLGVKQMLFVLSDRVPDGRDVSWIWDVDFEMLPENVSVIVSGERVYDLALRIKYSHSLENQKSKIKNQKYMSKLKILENLEEAINYGLNGIERDDILYVLPTYSAMLEVRKLLKGRKIL